MNLSRPRKTSDLSRKFFLSLAALAILLALSGLQNVQAATVYPTPCSIDGTNFSPACIWKLNHLRVAVVNSLFTSTAYFSNSGSFYNFYHDFAGSKNCVTQELDQLNLTLYSFGWDVYEQPLQTFVMSDERRGLLNESLVNFLTDVNVDHGSLFRSDNTTRRFDVAILGFTEYVSLREYNYLKQFVASGGKLIVLDGSSFLAEVNYNFMANRVSLVLGHGWSFNGTVACPSMYHRWITENSNWVGSEYCCFYGTEHYSMGGATANTTDTLSAILRKVYGNVTLFTSYLGHEENVLSNSTDSVIAYWHYVGGNFSGYSLPFPLVTAMYAHHYQKGVVIHTGIFATDMLSHSNMQFLVNSAMIKT